MVSKLPPVEETPGPSVSSGIKRDSLVGELANVDVDYVRRKLEHGEEHPGIVPGIGYEVEATGLMFGLSESEGIYYTWVSTLACVDQGKPYPSLVVVGNMGGNPSVAGGLVFENAPGGWGGGIPGEVPWQRPAGAV